MKVLQTSIVLDDHIAAADENVADRDFGFGSGQSSDLDGVEASSEVC